MSFFPHPDRHALAYAFSLAMFCFTPQLYADPTQSWLDAVTVSGYAKLTASAPNRAPTAVELDDLSLFVSGKFNRWLNPFMEAEAYKMPLWEESKGLQFNSAQLVIERLYNDIHITEDDTFRAGKFLAPINHWNIVHAAPLVWTTTRPVTSNYSRANYVTGFNIRHDFDALSGHALEVYWQPAAEFNPKPLTEHERHYQTVAGARWIAHEDLDYYLGVSFQHADVDKSNETRNSISVDGNWQHKWFELESELLFTQVDTDQLHYRHHDWGGYVQMAVPLVDHFNLIARYEHFEFANKLAPTDTALGGIVYRPVPRLSFKLEWQQTEGSVYQNQTGLYSSIAVLF
ncbi:hypothetical protein [Candidatus Methylobacter oryzae]|uniref:Uncharacterized protein n=1 Tax=Candidatus Methylobacter oryzae TaxID=2497749 RepID=A0ABY3C874_9GAMM|nr:hypothetical protein [Candidatus Methylobacter oryzae]TRW92690.1 hypothetical protein EKO24_014785 [Candidatus Methylobacter oryzae]